MEWHRLKSVEVLKYLESREHGLSTSEVRRRLELYGRNSLTEVKADSLLKIFLRQFQSSVIYVLLIAAAIMFFMDHLNDMVIILIVLSINAIIGTVQEGRAQNTLAALKNMVQTNASVSRDGVETIVPSEEVVAGDVMTLREGDKVPADARILSCQSLRVDESALTGESESVSKSTEIIDKKGVNPGDRKNMVFRGTFVVGGEAKAVVTDTGSKTVIGDISKKLAELDTDVPLKKDIQTLSKYIIVIVLTMSSLIFVIGLIRNIGMADMFLTAVAISVSAIPAGLPVVVTIVLAAGMYRMSRRNALVRKLQAVEALGQAQVIAVDKTGTVTMNQMMVEKIYLGGNMYDVSGNGYEPKGEICFSGKAVEPLNHDEMLLAGRISALTASASIAYSEEKKEWQRISGDPTEAALLSFSKKIGFDKDDLLNEYPKVFEIPFSSNIRYHASAHSVKKSVELYVAGAPETVMDKVKYVTKEGKIAEIDEKERQDIEQAVLSMSRLGLRTLALAANFRSPRSMDPSSLPELHFVGVVGISDSVRPGAREALISAYEAGVKVVMITGDYPETAKTVAAKVGIYSEGDTVITGKDLYELPEEELAKKLPDISVFARVSPEDKLKIIEAYRKQNIIIAMTGDGVNDALSLAAADLGVSMGKIGTEVAKEASDIVLMDDNFGSIVSAIEEGRNIFKSIKKVILYLFSTSTGEILTILAAIVLGYPLPLLAGQIIWLNFVTDGFLVVALALDPKEKDLLATGRRRARKIMDAAMIRRIMLLGMTMVIVTMFLFDSYLDQGFAVASTVALTVLAVCQWFNAFNCRSETRSVFNKETLTNPFLLAALSVVIILQILAVYWVPLQRLLGTVPLTLSDWVIIIGSATLIIVVEETRKLISRITKPVKIQ